ncbi:MAG: long-chain fatty acid--CoA ligase [Thermoanaerobaculia bacterium]|nr:long-chain fatty acid--CoA ligase [Thermoanaerobaculia bacterium]
MRNVIERLEQTARDHGDSPALAARGADGWRTTSWAEYRDLVLRAAAGMIRLGAPAGAGVAILSANRPEWAIADLGAIAAGAIPTGIFVTNSVEQCAYVVDHTEARLAVADTPEALAKLLAVRERVPRLATLVLLDGDSDAPGVVSWRRLLELGAEAGEAEVRARLAAARPEDVATLIYTSGTTGTPKGVELTHANLLFTAERSVGFAHRLGAGERQLSYLPLAHIAEQMLALHLPLQSGACVHYVPSLEALRQALTEVRPTHFFGVPRVWEKLQAGVEAALAEAPPLRRRLVGWARSRALAAGRAGQHGGEGGRGYALADRLVLSKIRARLGLERAAFCASAAAPIAASTLEFFFSIGVPLVEVYGLSETTGVITVSEPSSYRIGRVGRPLRDVEMRVADDGEILARGANIFRGYRKDPEGTAAAIDADGWFHTGDVGEVDAAGFLKITDRKKELLVTSGGKKIAPAPIEKRLQQILGVGHAVLLGEQRHYVAALVTLDAAEVPTLAARVGSAARSVAEAACCPRVRAFLDREIARVNELLARFESVRKFHVLPAEFSIPSGELTPTLKLKRRVVYDKYSDHIEALYAGES